MKMRINAMNRLSHHAFHFASIASLIQSPALEPFGKWRKGFGEAEGSAGPDRAGAREPTATYVAPAFKPGLVAMTQSPAFREAARQREFDVRFSVLPSQKKVVNGAGRSSDRTS